MKRNAPRRPSLPPLGERAAVDRLGSVLVVRSREEGGLLTLTSADLAALRRTLAEKRGGG